MVEWCKARARAQRWVEQVRLLKLEMECLIASDLKTASEWERRAAAPLEMRRCKGLPEGAVDPLAKYDNDEVLAAGLCAYAHKQANYHRERAKVNERLQAQQRAEVERFLAHHTLDGRYHEVPHGEMY